MREKVILFGASEGGRYFFLKFRDSYDIIAFVDNDSAKQGTLFCGLPVFSPKKTMELGGDAVYVCSIFVHQIRRQLQNDLGVPMDMIRFSPKEVIEGKDLHPFEDNRTRELAGAMIIFLQKCLWESGVHCLLDHGTLLGIVREGDVLPWDDDVDLSIPATQKDDALACLEAEFSQLPGQAECGWSLILGYQERIGAPGSCPMFLSLEPTRRTVFRPFTIEISLTYIEGDLAVQTLNQAPARHFTGAEWIEFKRQKVAVPLDYRTYLTLHYGDWHVPRNKLSFFDISNFYEPLAPTKRICLIEGGKNLVNQS